MFSLAKLKAWRKSVLTKKTLEIFPFILKENTYCHFLWDTVFIDFKCRVYTCGPGKPILIGNIRHKNLAQIWEKSRSLKLCRLMSQNRCLYCFPFCTNLNKKQKESVDNEAPLKDYPSSIKIRYGERCNISCRMCRQNHVSKQTIDNQAVKNHIDWNKVHDIVLEGGEVLFMKGGRNFYLWVTRVLGKKVNLITNGLLINNEWAKHLVFGSKWVQVSVNSATKDVHHLVNRGSRFDKVIANIKRLIAAKHKYNSRVSIIFKYTIVPENVHEIAKSVGFAERLGCDEISFGYDSSVPAFLRHRKELNDRIRSDLSRTITNGLTIALDKNQLQHLDIL